jgi:cyclopropane fatty-acyl-phospholipid synthase-like methyltransferase
MDFGCGFSPFPQFLAKQGFEVWGVDDNSQNTMGEVDKHGSVKYYIGNILDLDEKFDAIISCSVIEHITEADVDLIFPKMRELLGENGKMCHVIDHYFPEYGQRTRVNFTEMAKKFGFAVDETFCPEHPDFVSRTMDKIDFMYYPHKTGLFIKPARREARIMIGDDV